MLEIIYAAWIVVATNGMRYEYDKEPDPKLIPQNATIIEAPNYKIRHDDPYTVDDNGNITKPVQVVTNGAKAKAEVSGLLLKSATDLDVSDTQFFKMLRIQYMTDAEAEAAWATLKTEIVK